MSCPKVYSSRYPCGTALSRLAALGAVALLLLCLGSAPATAAPGDQATQDGTTDSEGEDDSGGSAGAEKKLELVGITSPLTIALRPCSSENVTDAEIVAAGACRTNVKGVPQPLLVGEETIAVRSASDVAVELEVRFVPDEGSGAVALPGSAKGVFLEPVLPESADSFGSLAKGELRVFRIRFRLPPGQPVSAIDGSLIVSTEEAAEAIRVTGALREPNDLSIQPQKLMLESGEDDAAVTLSGPGLIEFLRGRDFATPRTELEGGAGTTFEEFLPLLDRDDTVEASLKLPTPGEVLAGGNPNQVRVPLELEHGRLEPGVYAGTLRLSDLIPGAPAVEIELRSGRGWFCMVLVIFGGVFFVGLLTQIVTYAIRRRLLLKVLAQSKRAYEHVRCWPDGEAVASWNLGDLLGHSEDLDEFRLQGVRGLEQSVRSARSRADLDEDTERVLDMVARIQRWLRLEPAARRLVLVDAQADPKGTLGEAGKAKGWRESNTWRDTQVLREIARREPPDVKAADDLVWRLLRHAEWHHRMAAVWAAAGKAEEKVRLKVAKLDEELGPESKVGTRTAEEQDALDVRLDAFASLLDAPSKDDLPKPKEPPRDPSDASEEKKAGVTPVEWEASPNLFTGWATLDGQSYGQLAGKASRGARGLAFDDLFTEVTAYGGPGIAWSGVILLLTSVAYGLTKYSDTWGSDRDVLEAFLAGALGAVVVDWAALPIFQSIRVRSSKAAEESDEKKGDAEVEEGEGGNGEDEKAATTGKDGKPLEGEEAQGVAADFDAVVEIVKRNLSRLR